jgi:hypothetical protein
MARLSSPGHLHLSQRDRSHLIVFNARHSEAQHLAFQVNRDTPPGRASVEHRYSPYFLSAESVRASRNLVMTALLPDRDTLCSTYSIQLLLVIVAVAALFVTAKQYSQTTQRNHRHRRNLKGVMICADSKLYSPLLPWFSP